jgi:NTE family protein
MAAGPDLDRVGLLSGKWLELSTRDIFPGGTLTRVGHLLRQRPYLFSSAALARLITDWKPVERLEDLPVPLRVVTTPLAGDAAVYHRHGDLAQLLLASAAVPAVFAPVELPESCGHPGPHVDGGVADLVPVAGAADFAPTRVFVLDASIPARLPRGRTPIDTLISSMGVAMRARQVTDLGPGVAIHHLRTADLGVRMTDFSLTRQHLDDGRRAAEELLASLTEHDVTELPRAHSSRRTRLRERLGRAS